MYWDPPSGSDTKTRHNHGTSTTSDMDMTQQWEVNESDQTYPSDPIFKSQLQEVFTAYLPLKDALVASDLPEAKKLASSIQNALDEVDMKMVKGDAHIEWMKDLKILTEVTSMIGKENDLFSVSRFEECFHCLQSVACLSPFFGS